MTDNALTNYRPRFARPGNDDLSDDGSASIAFWQKQAQPYVNAADVWARALYGAFGQGPGVYDDEIIPAGVTLAGAAHSGSMFGVRPFNALGAGGRPRMALSDEQLASLKSLYADGRPMREIADAVGVSRTNLELARRGTSAGLPRALTPQLDEQLGKAYINGVPVQNLEKDYGVSKPTMRNAANRLRSSNPDEYSRPRNRYDPRRYIDEPQEIDPRIIGRALMEKK
jgi:hypothetical protein